MDTGKPKLLDQMKSIMRMKHYSLQTEKSYVQWVRRYIYFHNKRHPEEMGALAVEQNVSASTQNQTRLHGRAVRTHSRAIDEVYDQATKLRPGIECYCLYILQISYLILFSSRILRITNSSPSVPISKPPSILIKLSICLIAGSWISKR
jgi:hypothetical protein